MLYSAKIKNDQKYVVTFYFFNCLTKIRFSWFKIIVFLFQKVFETKNMSLKAMPNEYQFSGINENNSLCQTLPVVLNTEKRISPVHFLPSPVNPGGHTHRNPPKVFWQIDLALQLCTFKLHSSKSKD